MAPKAVVQVGKVADNNQSNIQKSVAVRNVARGEIWLEEYLVHHRDKVRCKYMI